MPHESITLGEPGMKSDALVLPVTIDRPLSEDGRRVFGRRCQIVRSVQGGIRNGVRKALQLFEYARVGVGRLANCQALEPVIRFVNSDWFLVPAFVVAAQGFGIIDLTGDFYDMRAFTQLVPVILPALILSRRHELMDVFRGEEVEPIKTHNV